MKAIPLVNGHFDGTTEAASLQPRQKLHKRVYRLPISNDEQPIYRCVEQAIEKSAWLKLQKLKGAP